MSSSRTRRFGPEVEFEVSRRRKSARLASAASAPEYLETNGHQTQRELGERLLLTSGGITVLGER